LLDAVKDRKTRDAVRSVLQRWFNNASVARMSEASLGISDQTPHVAALMRGCLPSNQHPRESVTGQTSRNGRRWHVRFQSSHLFNSLDFEKYVSCGRAGRV